MIERTSTHRTQRSTGVFIFSVVAAVLMTIWAGQGSDALGARSKTSESLAVDDSAGPRRGGAPELRAALFERRRNREGYRIKLFIFTRFAHERRGAKVRVFSNELNLGTRANEREGCSCSGLWVVTPAQRSGHRLLRGLKRSLQDRGRAGFAAQIKVEGGGPAAGFRVTDFNRRFRPFAGTE